MQKILIKNKNDYRIQFEMMLDEKKLSHHNTMLIPYMISS